MGSLDADDIANHVLGRHGTHVDGSGTPNHENQAYDNISTENTRKLDDFTAFDGTTASTLSTSTTISDSSNSSTSPTTSTASNTSISPKSPKSPPSTDPCIHTTITNYALEHPTQAAIAAWDGHLTYIELHSFSSALATHLLTIGVAPSATIALLFSKSCWAVVSMLSVLKSGNACVNLSQQQPPQRLRKILQKSRAEIVVTAPEHAALARELCETVVVVDEQLISTLPQKEEVRVRVTERDPAYILFTSGSTGEPKGIVIEHGALASSAAAHGAQWHIGPGTRVFQFAAYSFDVSVADVFTSLSRGACVCVPSERERVEDLAGAICRLDANWAFLTPSVANTLAPATVPGLKTLVLGGEPATERLVSEWADLVELVVCYGPAECSVYCAGTAPARVGQDPLNIGFAIGCQMFIVDAADHNVLMPPGSVGEIVVQGRIVARGYLDGGDGVGGPFLESVPWADAENGRLYKTGDLGCFNADGSINIKGRKDMQVKIRGQRVELGEIEHHLRKCLPDAKQVLVHTPARYTSGSAPHELVAFIVEPKPEIRQGHKDDNAWASKIKHAREDLENVLPSYMIPTLFVPLRVVPLTSNGKIDRSKLQEIYTDHVGTAASRSIEAHSTELKPGESLLRDFWSKVLHTNASTISPQDNFLHLGGDSLKAMQLISLASDVGVSLSFHAVLSAPSLETMAKKLAYAADTEYIHNNIPEPFSLVQSENFDGLKSACAASCDVDPDFISDIYPATPLQEGLMMLSHKAHDEYISKYVFQIPSDIAVNQIRVAWAEAYERLDILRTRLVYDPRHKSTLQVVLREEALWTTRESSDESLGLERLMTYGKPLSSLTYVRGKSAEEGRIIWSVHHSLIDAVSVGLVFDLVATNYRNLTTPSPIPFKSFVARLSSFDKHSSNDWWKQYLSDASASTWPPTIANTTNVATTTHNFILPSPRNHAFTLATCLRAAWAHLISTYSDSTDIIFGSTNSGRSLPLPGILSVAGPTIVTVPFRIIFQEAQTLQALLQAVQNDASAMTSHEHIGLQEIARLDASTRTASQFRSLLIVQPRRDKSSLENITSMVDVSDPVVGSYPLTLECKEHAASVEMVLNFQPESVPEAIAQRLLLQMEDVVVTFMTGAEDALVSDNHVRVPRAFGYTPLDWNQKSQEALQTCVQVEFRTMVAKQPLAPAVQGWDAEWSYAVLDELSTSTAYALHEGGVRPDSIVPICSTKSAWVVVAMLAVLKTGAAFLPLDPSHPPNRLKRIVERVEAKTVICSVESVPIFSGAAQRVIDTTQVASSASVNGVHNFPAPDPASLAYLIFTSGSTGEPKGVEISHRAFCSGALARAPLINRTNTSRVFQFSSYGFDTSVEDILTTLITGGCVCVPSEQDRRDNFAVAFAELGANTADITPSLAHVLNPDDLPGLETLILGGEFMGASLVQKWSSAKRKLINTYGPTECAIVATVTKPLSSGTEVNTIGCMPCGRAWITSPSNHNRLVPKGAVGELLIEGPLLARGYHRDFEQTKRAFVKGVSWAHSDTVFYKTGDLAMLNEDDSLVFLGRKDSQVKIRGQRVELAEVEMHLRAASGTENVVVEMMNTAYQEQCLVAFLAMENSKLETEALPMTLNLHDRFQACLQKLRSRVPTYMVPTILIPMTCIPLTRSGKVDRKALQQMFHTLTKEQLFKYRLADQKHSSQLIENSHRLLGSIWSEVLGVGMEYFDAEMDFFQAGGDSLSAVRLASSLQDAGFQLSVSDIFRHAKLSDMALHMKARTINGESTKTAPEPEPFSLLPKTFELQEFLEGQELDFTAEDVEDAYPTTPTQEALMALSAKQPRAYMASFAHYIQEKVDSGRLRSAWDYVVRHFPILRTRILVDAEVGAVQVVLRVDAETVSAFQASQPQTMSYGDALFCVQFLQADGKHVVQLTIHHALFDAESLDMIYKQVEQVYETGQISTRRSSIPRFIAALGATDEEAERTFWRQQLEGTPSAAFFITPRANEAMRREEITTHSIALHETLRARISSSKHTPALLLRAAWALTIASFTNADDVLFGVTLSGRNAAYDGTQQLVAPTMTTIPLRIRVDKAQPAHDFLDTLTGQAADMIPYEHTGLHKIQRHISRHLEMTNILVVQYAQSAPGAGNALISGAVEAETLSADYYTEDLVLECTVAEKEIQMRAYFDASKVQQKQLAYQLSCFAHLFKQLLSTNEAMTLSSLQLCDPDSFAQVCEWNMQTIGQAESHTSIHALVHEMAVADPDRTAIISWDGSVTFGELERHAENLAHYISSLGLRTNTVTVIPILFGKSIYAVIAMLGIMKAGRAYTALDVANPVQRLKNMVGQVRAHLCLAAEEHKATLEGVADKVLVVDGELLKDLESRAIGGTAHSIVSPNDPAIIVFTSGSTGSPKPIVLSHRAVTSCARAYGPGMDFGRDSRVLSNAAYAFDIHACEIFLTLIHGGTLYFTNRDRASLVEVINEWRINWLFSTPSALEFLPGPDAIPTVKTLMMIGEAPSSRVYTNWVREGLHLINAYGPAENTLFSTMTSVDSPHQDPTMIGRPCNTAAWVIDPNDHARVCQIGAVGELMLQGEQLSDGYLYEPDKTTAAFVPAPQWMSHVGRKAHKTCYLTGDLCQLNVDGTLRILGRTDSQVKLRGQRLETAEVEVHLRRFIDPELVVDCLNFSSGRQALAAFVVCEDSSSRPASRLIASATEAFKSKCQKAATALENHLPQFMIPTLFVPIYEMPRTASDKLDRKLLRATMLQLPEHEALGFTVQDTESLTPPTTDSEHMLQELWAKVLGLESHQIGTESSFEALGGDSIAAIRLAVAVRSSGNGKTLAVIDILRFPRLAQMAGRLENEVQCLVEPQSKPFTLIPPAELASLRDLIKLQHGLDFVDAYPCTPLQEGFMRATAQNCHAYVSHQVFKIAEHVDLRILRSIWRDVLSKYAILKSTIITTAGGDMVQIVRPHATESQLIDVPSISSYLEYSKAHAVREGSPLFKVGFVEEQERKIVVTAHHAVFDAWFFSELVTEIDARYKAREDTIGEPVPFVSFVKHVQAAQTKLSQSFWQATLEGQTTSQVFSASDGHQRSRKECSVSRTFGLHDTGPYSASMLPVIVRAAWGLLLSLYADSADVTFGLILNGRSGADGTTDFDAVAGPTVTTVPFRVSIDRDQTTGGYIDGVKKSSIDILPHQFYDLKRGAESADVVAATNFDNILDVVVTSDDTSKGSNSVLIPDGSAKLSQQSSYYLTPLVMLATIRPSRDITLDLTHDSNIISGEKATQIGAQLELLISQLASMSPGTPLADLNLLTRDERSLVESWNAQDPEQSAARHCIHDLVARTITRHSDWSALEAWDGSLTYKQLDEVTSRIAQHLIDLGVTSQSRIPLCFDKSLWTPVAMLACLKAGAAYVPLDPSHPTQRLHTIVNFVGGGVMMAGDTQSPRFDGVVPHVITLTSAFIDTVSPLQAPFESRGKPEDTAIVVFTSGSTGMPKGVELSHTSFCTLAAEVGDEMDLTKIENLRVLQFAAYAFDVSNAETFLTLIHGGTLCIIPDEEKQNNLAGAINRLNINWLYLTPTATSLLEPSQVQHLKTLILGGEAGSRDIVAKWAPHLHLVNSFGPAEGGIWPSMSHLTPGSSPQNIGRSAGTRLWIVHPDNHEQLMGPIGAVGELLLEGPMLATGYLHEPEKTAAAFLAPPQWAASLGAKGVFYKTGDLCYYNTDGSLSYVGRKDGQVKLRGQRLDLGDVEHAIKECLQEPIGVAVEVVHFADRKDPALAAFLCSETFIPADGSENEKTGNTFFEVTSSLQQKLQLRLPPYMVPSAFIPLRAMPLTMSGKRNRKALKGVASEMAFSDLAAKNSHTRKHATTEMELQVRRVCATVLGINPEDIYASDNFLELGGNSIHVMRVVALLKAVDMDIKVAEVFRSKDLSAMAECCRAVPKTQELELQSDSRPIASISDTYPGLVENLCRRLNVKEDDIEDIIPAGDFQSHCVYFGSLESRGTANYLSFTLPAGIDTTRIQSAYEAVVAKYPMLRTLFASSDLELLQVVVKSWTVEIERITNVEDGARCRDDWIAKDKSKSSTLDKPLVRGAMIECQDGSTIFVCQQSHARNDAWSDQHFCRDLVAAYEGRDLPSRPTFAQVIRHTQQLDAARTDDYWRTLLADSSMTEIVSHQRPSYDNIVNITLERTVSGCDISQMGITTATVLKTAWALVLAEYAQSQDVVFGHLTSGRSQGIAEMEEVFGPCLNIVPVRVRLDDHQTIEGLLRNVQEQHVAGLEHEWMGERTIVRRCTNWPLKTRFSSVVQYQNINEVREVETDSGSNWGVKLHAIDYDSADVWILAWPETHNGESHLKVTLCFSEKLVELEFAERMLRRLCELVQIVSSIGMQRQPIRVNAVEAQLPLSGPPTRQAPYFRSNGKPMPSQCMLERLRDVVLNVWAPLLKGEREGLPERHVDETNTAYYDLTSSPWVATQLALEYQSRGLPVAVEDIIVHPTVETQMFLLARSVT